MPSQSIESLTRREREILEYIAKGESLTEIAQRLGRSLKTIESHRLSLGRKLGVSNRVELTHIAIAEGLVPLQSGEHVTEHRINPAGHAETQLSWLQQINNACLNATGATFIKQFCNAASKLPGITTAIVCTPNPTHTGKVDQLNRYMIGISTRGVEGDPFRFHGIGEPCETLLSHGEVSVLHSAIEAFPNTKVLKEVKAESYIGIALQREDGSHCGGCALIGREPLESFEPYQSVIRFFAPRLSSELSICVELDALRLRCEQLQSLSETLGNDTTTHPEAIKTFFSSSIAIRSQIDKDVQHLAGAAFLRGFTNSLCHRLGVKVASLCMFVDQSDKKQLASIMYSVDGKMQENFTYNPANMPCELSLQSEVFCMPKGAQEAFPGNQFIIEMQLEAYIGIRLMDTLDDPVGTMWVTHTDEIADSTTVEHVLRHYAPRISAELANFKKLEGYCSSKKT